MWGCANNFYHYYNQKWVCVYTFLIASYFENDIVRPFLIYLKNICKIVTCKYPNYIVVLDLYGMERKKGGKLKLLWEMAKFSYTAHNYFQTICVCAIKPLSFNMQFWNRIHVMISDGCCGMKEKVIKTKCMTHYERGKKHNKKLLWHAKRAECSRMNSLSESYV